jgi:tetratricopeptide (TPR) repeat protein
MEACVSDNDVSESSEFEAGQAEGGQAEAGQETATAVAEAPVEATQAAPDAPRPLTDAERAKLAELDEQIARFEGQKRWSDVIKSILAKAEIHRERDEKVALLSLAGSMFLEKSSNQAEAIKAYEAVIQLDAKNLEALTRLKEMYEKRRDWEKLVGVMKLETELMDPSDRGLRYVEMAQLATEKLRKPEVCIDLWKSVLRLEPDNADALTNLAGLYEKAREWAPLAEILESQSTRIADEKELVAALNKLGMIYADKLGDDAGAVGAFKRLLTLDPNDRRAQEQLKKRFVSLKAWGDLEEFYATQDKWDELIRTLERETENKDAPAAEKIDLFFRIARLWAEKKDKTDRAAKSLEKVLELDPKNFEAAVALTPIYEAANDAKRLAGVYEVRLGHVSDPAERVLLLRESGLLYEERLKDPDTAFERFLEAFSLSPLTEVVREDVERVAAGVDGWDRVVAHYAAAIAKAETPVDAIELRMNLGRVLAAMGRTDEAIREFQSVWAAESDHLGAMAALETLFRATARFRELLAVYTRRAELESDPDARRKLAYDVAALYERELQNPPEAIDAYRGILAEYGDEDGEAHRALDRLYEGEGRWADLAAALERRIDLNPADEQELAALKYRLARTLEQRLDDKARAVDLYREILSLQPEHVGAREALEALLGDAAHGANAAEILEPIYELRGDAESLIKSLEVLHAASDDGARKLELLTKVGAVLQAQVGDADRAFEVYGRALRGAPASLETLESLEALASEPARHARLVALVSLLAGEHAESDAALSRTLWIKAARLNEGEGGDIDAAVAAYGRVLAQDSGDLEVLEALDALYRRSERWRDLLGVLRRKVELSADPAAQEALLEQMARIHDEQLSEPALAASLYREILEIEPTSQGALVALDALYARLEQWSELADNVGRQLVLAEDPERRTALQLRLAELRETRMGAVDAAIEIHRHVLETDPGSPAALGALERLLAKPEHQIVIAEILEPLYREQNDFRKLIGIHEVQLQHATSPDQRISLLHGIAELHEVALDDLPGALATFARALAEDASNQTTQESLERLAGATGDFAGLAGVYESQAEKLLADAAASGAEPDIALASSLLMKAASVQEDQLGAAPAAVTLYQRVLGLDGANLDAASALERLFAAGESYEDLAKTFLLKASILESLDEQKEHLFRAAAIYEEILERPADAIAVYRRVLELDGEELRALDKLIELHLKLSEWEPLLGVYARKADLVSDPLEKKSLLVELGAVHERELGDTAKAIDAYERVLELDPDDLTALGRLDVLYQASGNWKELLSVLEHEAELAGDPTEVLGYRFRVAELWQRRLGDASRAVEGYRELLEVVPDHEPTIAALEEMIRAGAEPVAAAGVLEPVYRAAAEWARLIAVHEVQIAHEPDPVRKTELLHAVAELYETALDDAANAFGAYARALPIEPSNEHTLSSLERLAEPLGRWDEVTRLYDLEVDKLRDGNDGERLVETALRVAQIYEVRVGNVDAAIARYATVLGTDDLHRGAIEALDRLYEATERWSDLVGILRREAQTADSPDDILTFQYRLGELFQIRIGDTDAAIEQYREILGAAPEHAPALAALEGLFAEGVRALVIGEVLEPLYRMSEAYDRLLGVHTVQLSHLAEPGERLAMMHKMAEIAEERANDHQTALEWELRALLEAPTDERASAEVDRLAQIQDQWALVAQTLADILEGLQPAVSAARPGARETAVATARRLASVYEAQIGDVARAEEAYRYVLGADGGDRESLAALDRIYLENGAHEALAEVLRRQIAVRAGEGRGSASAELVELGYRLGQVYENDLQRPTEAITAYRKVIEEFDAQHADSILGLANVYTRLGDWASLYQTFERELEVVAGDSARSDVFAKMARLASDHLGRKEQAVGLWQKVLDLRGEDVEALNALGDLYGADERWRDLVDILEREVNVVDDDETRVVIYADLGRIWYERLQKDRNALEAWERVLDLDPGSTHALSSIATIHRNAGQTAELVDALQRTIDVGAATLDDASLEGVYRELALLFETSLSQPADAVDAYEKALALNPGNFGTLEALERIHVDQGNWEDAIAVKERRHEVLDDEEAKIAELLAIAGAWETQVGDADRGTSAYQRVLELAPTHEAAFEKLATLHREAARWEELVTLYVTRVEAIDDEKERVVLLRKVADVYEKELDDRNNAFETLQIAWSSDFTDPVTAAELERVAALTQRWAELLQSANEALPQVEDPALKIAICLRCAKWYGTELKHPEYAIPYYQQILALDPANLPAMRQMSGLYRQTQQWPTLSQVLTRLADTTTDPGEKMSVFVQLGELAETHRGMPEQAAGLYQKALDIDHDSVDALEALERVFTKRQQWNELRRVLQRKVAAISDPVEQAAERVKIAELLEDRLQNPDEAIEIYRQVLEADAESLSALKGLERLYTLRERWQELIGVLEAQLDVVRTEKERIAILSRLAGMWEELFVKPEKAAERLEQILDVDPNHEPSLRALARMYRQLQRWDDLVNTYERHVSATPDRREKIELFQHIGAVFATDKSDVDRAIDAYLNVIGLDEGHVPSLDALARLYDKRGDHGASLDMMEQLSRRLSDPQQLVDLRHRMGRLYDERLGDRATAVDKYQSALDVEPGHLPSLEAMRKIHVDNGDWLSASRVLEQETRYTQAPRQLARLFVELGQINDQRLDEHDRAVECFESAYAQDADNEDAAMPLAAEYVKEGAWSKAAPLLDMLVKRANRRPNAEQHALWFDLGRTSTELGDDERALKAFTNANTLDPQHLPSLQGLAAVNFRLKDWEKAFKFYQMILVHHRDTMARDEVTDTFHRLGAIKREQGERRKALNMFDKALEEDAQHRPTLEAVVALYAEGNEWEQVIHYKKQLLEVVHESEQFTLLDQIGDLWKDKLKNPQKAMQSYADGLVLQPKSHVLMHKLLALYQEQKMWDRAIEIIQRISDLDDRSLAKAKYAYAIGVIVRDELKDAERAVAKFDEALDLDPTQLKPFEAINKIWTTQKDWRQLERAFRKMIKRIVGKGNTDLEWNLWHNLGVIYRDRMQKHETAAEAFKMATNLRPDDVAGHVILAELYALVPARLQDAIDEHQYLLRQDFQRVDSYRALYKLYFDARAYDKAWCVANTLLFLKRADAEQQQFVEQYRTRGLVPRSRLDNERFVKDLFHPDEDFHLGKMFEAVLPAVLGIKMQNDKQLGLVKKEQVDPATSTVTFAKTFGFVGQVLSLPVPRLFLKPGVPGGLAHAVAEPIASVCGSSLLSGHSPQDLAFIVAHHLAYYRGEHYMMRLLPTQPELKLALMAGLRIVGLGAADPAVDQWAQMMQPRLSTTHMESLRVVAKRFIDAGGRGDVKRWMQAVELTACRAGLLVCSDLETAQRMVASLPSAGPQDLPPKDKLKELVLFSVSEQYFRLREALGIQINIG